MPASDRTVRKGQIDHYTRKQALRIIVVDVVAVVVPVSCHVCFAVSTI